MQKSCDSLFPLRKVYNETNLHFLGRWFSTINVSSILEFHSWNRSPITNWLAMVCALGLRARKLNCYLPHMVWCDRYGTWCNGRAELSLP